MEPVRSSSNKAALPALALALAACGGGGGGDDGSVFGEGRIVAVVNPAENDGNTAESPAVTGTAVADVGLDANPGTEDTTGEGGIGVVRELEVGPTDLVVEGGPIVGVEVVAPGDVYDVAIGYDGESAEIYSGFPIAYAVGGDVIDIVPGDDASVALSEDGRIVFFEDGVYEGDILIEGEDVTLFGESGVDDPVVIDGNVEVRGGAVRIRGARITGDLTVKGNNFGMSFSVVEGDTLLQGQGISFLGNVFCLGAQVPSSNAALYANAGLPPIAAPAAPACPE